MRHKMMDADARKRMEESKAAAHKRLRKKKEDKEAQTKGTLEETVKSLCEARNHTKKLAEETEEALKAEKEKRKGKKGAPYKKERDLSAKLDTLYATMRGQASQIVEKLSQAELLGGVVDRAAQHAAPPSIPRGPTTRTDSKNIEDDDLWSDDESYNVDDDDEEEDIEEDKTTEMQRLKEAALSLAAAKREAEAKYKRDKSKDNQMKVYQTTGLLFVNSLERRGVPKKVAEDIFGMKKYIQKRKYSGRLTYTMPSFNTLDPYDAVGGANRVHDVYMQHYFPNVPTPCVECGFEGDVISKGHTNPRKVFALSGPEWMIGRKMYCKKCKTSFRSYDPKVMAAYAREQRYEFLLGLCPVVTINEQNCFLASDSRLVRHLTTSGIAAHKLEEIFAACATEAHDNKRCAAFSYHLHSRTRLPSNGTPTRELSAARFVIIPNNSMTPADVRLTSPGEAAIRTLIKTLLSASKDYQDAVRQQIPIRVGSFDHHKKFCFKLDRYPIVGSLWNLEYNVPQLGLMMVSKRLLHTPTKDRPTHKRHTQTL